jgi:hypothetical protein
MPALHDAAFRETLRTRLKALRPDAKRKWGKMSLDQMLWHVASGLETSVGRRPTKPMKAPLPRPIMRFLVINAPWPKGAPTMPEIVAKGQYDVEAERKRCLDLIDEMVKKDLDGPWPVHPILGNMRGVQHSKLQGKHVDHHLKQFGA